MIDIPAKEIIAKVVAEKGLTEDEVRTKVQAKLQQLSGLISEDGAAHIVANELGVSLVPEPGAAKIKDLHPGMRGVTVPGRITRLFEVRTFNSKGREGKVGSFFIGDETGQMRVTLWNDQTDQFSALREGGVVRVSNAVVKENRGYKELHLNPEGKLEVDPAGVTVAEVAQPSERRERKTISELAGDEDNVELLGTVVQLYDPRFFDVCPECNKRVTQTESGVQCAAHGDVRPVTNYVVSAYLDDGTGTMRTTFWKNQTQRLLGKDDAGMLAYQENPSAFEEVKTAMLGEIIKVVGRVKKNDQFDRVEFTANLVFTDVDPEEELARLQASGDAKMEPAKAAPAKAEPAEPEKPPAAPAQAAPKPAAPAPAPEPVREAPQAPIEEGVVQGGEEEAISLDDLEDLDEKL